MRIPVICIYFIVKKVLIRDGLESKTIAYIFYNIFYIINQPYIIIIISCILKPYACFILYFRLYTSFIFILCLLFYSIYIYFYLYSSLFIVYFICYIMYIYNIIHVPFFFLCVLGRLAVVLRVYRVKIVSASVHISLCLCTQGCLCCPRA